MVLTFGYLDKDEAVATYVSNHSYASVLVFVIDS